MDTFGYFEMREEEKAQQKKKVIYSFRSAK